MDVKLTITERCSATCDSCLTHQISNPRDMEFSTFKNVIGQIKLNSDKFKKLHMYSIGESLLHKDFNKMLTYAERQLKEHRTKIIITTNGSLPLKKIPLGKAYELVVSFNGFNKKEYKQNTGLNWDKVLANIKEVAKIRKLEVHILNFYNHELDELDEEIIKLSKNDNIRVRISNKIDNQCGALYDATEEREPCDYIHDTICIAPNGDYLRCAHDFFSEYVYGNIKNMSFKQVLRHKLIDYRKHTKQIYEGICENCNFNKKSNENEIVYLNEVDKNG